MWTFLYTISMSCPFWVLFKPNNQKRFFTGVLQRILNNYDLSIKIIYMLGTLCYAVGTVVMSIFPNVYVAMVMISTMGIISMSMSYCPYALLGQYHEIKEVCIILLTRVTKYMMLPIIQTTIQKFRIITI